MSVVPRSAVYDRGVRVIVIGGTGTIGRAVVNALQDVHEVIAASRSTEPHADLADTRTIAQLLERSNNTDAVVCCAANAPLVSITEVSEEEFVASITPKLLGQVGVAIHAAAYLRDGGSITLTSGVIPEGTSGAAGGAMVNAGLEAFVRGAAQDLGRGLRINAVCPGWVAETMAELGMDATQGTPATEVARAYVAAVEGSMRGEILRPGA
jgi:NAD(P)-dependent dehydrogenase (short-subunit alcohol dehydrogenase family)